MIIHTILSIIINLFFIIIKPLIWIGIICWLFRIKNKYLPFGWLEMLFNNILVPLIKKLFYGLLYLLKVLFKWLFYSIEKLLLFLGEILKKLFELVADPRK